MKPKTLIIPALTVIGVGLLAMGGIDDKIISTNPTP